MCAACVGGWDGAGTESQTPARHFVHAQTRELFFSFSFYVVLHEKVRKMKLFHTDCPDLKINK